MKLCFASIDKYKGDYTVIRLTDDTLSEYIDLPDFIWQNDKILNLNTLFLLIYCVLSLLNTYGGIWADATILLTSPISDKIVNQDFFMFQRDMNAKNQDFWTKFNTDYFGWHDKHYINVLNSFIVAKKDNEVINTCLNLLLNYWQNQNYVTHYFFFQIMFDVLIKDYLMNKKL